MSNPIIERTELSTVGNPLTIKGVINKTAFLLALSAVVAIGLFFYGMNSGMAGGMFRMIGLVGFGVGLVLYFIMLFKPHMAKSLAVPYALCEGLLLGGISGAVYYIFPSVPLTALCATFITAAGMLSLYRSGVIKVTAKFRSIVTSATLAIFLLYMVQLFLHFALGSTIPMLFDGGMIAIGFSLFVICIASFNLLLDFDNIEHAAAAGVSEDMEWVLGVGIVATLVWMYIEFIRLLSYLQD